MENHKVINDFIIKLKYDAISKEMFLGIMITLLMNKSIFMKNNYVSEFIEDVFSLEVPKYATKSRTLMVAKICRVIFNFDERELTLTHKKALSFLNGILTIDIENKPNYKKKSKNALANMNKWVGGILDKNE